MYQAIIAATDHHLFVLQETTMKTDRRTFLAAAAAATAIRNSAAAQDGRPQVRRARATDGDEKFEPDWESRLTLTVGTKQGDLIGHDDRVLQAAVDYVARMGGGTVRVLPGKYTLRNAVCPVENLG